MRGHTEKAVGVLKAAAAAALLLFCAIDTGAVSAAVALGIKRCLYTVIPSLFAMMAVSSVIVRSGITGIVPAWAGKAGRAVFGMDGGELPIYAFSMFAGYPVGVKMLCEEYRAGRITKERAELLSGLCFGAGPAFIFGCVSQGVTGSVRVGMLILISTVSANMAAALIMSLSLRTPGERSAFPRRVSISADMLTDCVLRSGRAMADICIMITAFSVITAFFVRTGAMAAAGELLGKLPGLGRRGGEALAAALIDVTNAEGLSRGGLLLPYVSAAVSFGGLCVMSQLAVLTAGKLSLRPFVLIRTATAVLSYFICRLLLPFFIVDEVTEVSAVKVCGYGHESAVPSVMLIIMTLMLLREYGEGRNARSAYST